MLVIRDKDGSSFSLYSQEGVTQGDPAAMLAYGIGTLTLIRILKLLQTNALHIWYANNARIGSTFNRIDTLYRKLQQIGPDNGNYPEPAKSVLVMHENAQRNSSDYFKHHGFKTRTGQCFLGGYKENECKP